MIIRVADFLKSGFPFSWAIALCLLSSHPAFPQPPALEGTEWKEGIFALHRKDLSGAIRRFESLAEKGGPQRSAALYYLGYVYYLEGRYIDSRRAFREGYDISPEEVHLLQEKTSDVLGAGTEVSPLAPEEKVHPRFQKGARLLFGKDFSAATEEFRTAVQEAPARADFLYYLGYSLYELKKFEEARDSFQEAYRLQPDYIPPLPRQGL